MRKFNFFLLFVLILMLVFGGYFYFGSTLGASAAPITASANDYPEVFSSIKAIVTSGTAPQTFSEPMPDSTDGLTLVDATIALQNRGLFAAEWLDIRVNGVAGDIAVVFAHRSGVRRRRALFGSDQLKADHPRARRNRQNRSDFLLCLRRSALH